MTTFRDFSLLNVTGDPGSFWEQRMAYDGSGNLEYLGFCKQPNGSTSESIWLIVKYTYSGSNVTRQQMADDGPKFGYAWDSRATYFS